MSDSVSTQYNGFGGVINGSPEIFTGSQGLANVRTGDRVEVRGVGQRELLGERGVHHASRPAYRRAPNRRRKHAATLVGR